MILTAMVLLLFVIIGFQDDLGKSLKLPNGEVAQLVRASDS